MKNNQRCASASRKSLCDATELTQPQSKSSCNSMFVDRPREERLLPNARRSHSIHPRMPRRFSRARIGLFRKWRTDSVPSKKVMAREPTERGRFSRLCGGRAGTRPRGRRAPHSQADATRAPGRHNLSPSANRPIDRRRDRGIRLVLIAAVPPSPVHLQVIILMSFCPEGLCKKM